MKFSHFSPREPRESDLSKAPFERDGRVLKLLWSAVHWEGAVQGGWKWSHRDAGILREDEGNQLSLSRYLHINPRRRGQSLAYLICQGLVLAAQPLIYSEYFPGSCDPRAIPGCRDQGFEGLTGAFCFWKARAAAAVTASFMGTAQDWALCCPMEAPLQKKAISRSLECEEPPFGSQFVVGRGISAHRQSWSIPLSFRMGAVRLFQRCF